MAVSEEQMRQIEEREFPGWLRGRGMTPFQYEVQPAARKEEAWSEFRAWLRENNSSYMEAASTYEGLRQVFEEMRQPRGGP